MDGSSFYQQQSVARNITTLADVEAAAVEEHAVFEALIAPFLPEDKGAMIYEAATGPGILQCWLRDRGYRNRIGSDFAEAEAGLAALVSSQVCCADSVSDLKLRVAPDSASAIIGLDFFEHLPRESFREFLAIAFSRLKPGGVLILRGPNADSPLVGLNLYNDVTHVWAYTTVCLNSLLRLAGFDAINYSDDTLGGFHSGGWWKRPLMRPAQWILTTLVYLATRQRIRHWGMSIYVYARKTNQSP